MDIVASMSENSCHRAHAVQHSARCSHKQLATPILFCWHCHSHSLLLVLGLLPSIALIEDCKSVSSLNALCDSNPMLMSHYLLPFPLPLHNFCLLPHILLATLSKARGTIGYTLLRILCMPLLRR